MSSSGDNEVELLGDNHDGRPNTRLRNQIREQKAHQQEKEKNKVTVKQEKMLEKGFTYCPVCKMPNLVVRGCKTVTCTRTRGHPNGRSAFYCGYCQMLSKYGDPPKCKCRYSFNLTDRLEVAADPGLRTVDLSNYAFSEGLEYYQSIPGGDEDNTFRASTDSSSVSERVDNGRDSDAIGSDKSTNTVSAMNEDNHVDDVVPTAALSDCTIQIKQEPDTVPSTAFEEETVGNEIYRQEVMSSTAIPVVVKVKTEVAAVREDTDVEDSASPTEDGGEEDDDIAAPIHEDSQRREKEAAAAEEEEGEPREAAPKKRRKVSSARKASAAAAQKDNGQKKRNSRGGKASEGKRKSSENEEERASTTNATKKRSKKRECSAEGCTNQAVRGGVCVTHGANVKRCSSGGCTNKALKGGVCIRHGAKVKQCSREGCSNQVVRGEVCIRHGAKKKQRKLCNSEGCTNQVIKGGVCVAHGAKTKQCRTEGCSNQAVKGGVCVRHGAKVKQCSREGCSNQVVRGEVCIRHGAKVTRKLCCTEGCTNQAKKGGVCKKHGANRL